MYTLYYGEGPASKQIYTPPTPLIKSCMEETRIFLGVLILLYADLLKRTDTQHCDYKTLEQAVESLKTVMT